MTNLQVMVTEAGEPTFLHLATSPLAAAYVLAIHIRRQPASMLSWTHSEVCPLRESMSTRGTNLVTRSNLANEGGNGNFAPAIPTRCD
jgi:hypothetical protein